MAHLDINTTTITDLTNKVDDFTVDTQDPDSAQDQKETIWTFSNATRDFSYYKTIPELKKAVDALAMWVSGKGFTADIRTTMIMEGMRGWGEDSIESIIWNLIVMKKVIGDSFAEIIRFGEKIVNIKPLFAGNMKTVVNKQGIIIRYDYQLYGKKTKFKPHEILHLVNDRIADEIHGTSVIDSVKWVIDARNEALKDYRKVLHRNVIPVRIIEVDTDNVTKRNALIAEYEDAIAKGEVLVIPKGTVQIQDNTIVIQDPTTWIRYLENFFYQAVGLPKVILGGSEEFTEASSKIGYLTFEQVYMREQRELEADIWNQLGLRIKFNKPASLKNELLGSEQKNTGQVGFQENETTASLSRSE